MSDKCGETCKDCGNRIGQGNLCARCKHVYNGGTQEEFEATLRAMIAAPQEWTVVGLWDDSRETWIEYGKGDTADAAIFDALAELRDTEVNLDGLTILAVFPGRHEEGAFEGMGPVSASEWDGVDDEKRSSGPRRNR